VNEGWKEGGKLLSETLERCVYFEGWSCFLSCIRMVTVHQHAVALTSAVS